jgi:hypothetical protein
METQYPQDPQNKKKTEIISHTLPNNAVRQPASNALLACLINGHRTRNGGISLKSRSGIVLGVETFVK